MIGTRHVASSHAMGEVRVEWKNRACLYTVIRDNVCTLQRCETKCRENIYVYVYSSHGKTQSYVATDNGFSAKRQERESRNCRFLTLPTLLFAIYNTYSLDCLSLR